jgi:peptidoglycan/xylan/chitin deacetylase (PgdA/CDA1 family)
MKFATKVRTIFLLILLAPVDSSRLTIASSARHLSFDRAVTSQKIVALTFDADMTPRMSDDLKTGKTTSWYNQRVVATLREEHVPATLFLAGLWIERYPAVTQDLSADPLFEIGNHSYSHPGFRSPCYGLASLRKSSETVEVEKTDALLKKYTTSHQNYFRFPGLCFDAGDVETIEAQGYTVIGGDVYSGDGFEKSATKIVSNVLAHVRPGSIVILHMHGGPNAPRTADALPDIIKKLRLRGYTFVKVSDLLSLSRSKD